MSSHWQRKLLGGCLAWLFASAPAAAQPADREIVFDRGLLRWQDTRAEVALFGVNYYPPFHWNYADLKTIGADPEQTIRADLGEGVEPVEDGFARVAVLEALADGMADVAGER